MIPTSHTTQFQTLWPPTTRPFVIKSTTQNTIFTEIKCEKLSPTNQSGVEPLSGTCALAPIHLSISLLRLTKHDAATNTPGGAVWWRSASEMYTRMRYKLEKESYEEK
jgi:hypothetical protein